MTSFLLRCRSSAGYTPVAVAAAAALPGCRGGGRPTLTGPSFVDSSHAETILPFAENNTCQSSSGFGRRLSPSARPDPRQESEQPQ